MANVEVLFLLSEQIERNHQESIHDYVLRLTEVADSIENILRPITSSDYQHFMPADYNGILDYSVQFAWLNNVHKDFFTPGNTRKITCIKAFRDRFRYDLISAKSWVEAYLERFPQGFN